MTTIDDSNLYLEMCQCADTLELSVDIKHYLT